MGFGAPRQDRAPRIFVVAATVAVRTAVVAAISQKEEEEAILKASNVGISVMLLGSISFMMGLFYLVNHHDPDMVKYCWQVISSTISIFSAVLLFQGVNGIVEEMFMEGASRQMQLFVGLVHFMVWFCMLQLALAWISGALAHGAKEMTEEAEDRMERQIKCYAILLGHITGFAAISAFGTLQQQVPRTVPAVLSIAPAAWVVVYILGQVMDQIRDKVNLADDGKVDRAEQLWDEETQETEDDVIGLAVSFLVVQTVRLSITGQLPSAEGEEPEREESSHSDHQVFTLIAVGLGMVAVELWRTAHVKVHFPRLVPQLRNSVMMSFAWCLFFGVDWWLSHHVFVSDSGMIKQVVLSLLVTMLAFTVIFFLDKLADMPSTDNSTVHAIRSVVKALGILIGFSWEKAFDSAVASASTDIDMFPPLVTKLLLAIVLSFLVVPAWRHFILPTVIAYERLEEEEEEEEEAPASKDGKLEEPLLAKGAKGKAKAKVNEPPAKTKKKKMAPGPKVAGKDAYGWKKQCKEYEDHILALETRNATLEARLDSFSSELGDLQMMADLLKRSAVGSAVMPQSP